MNSKNRVEILKYKRGELSYDKDEVITEYPLTIRLNGEELVTLLCTPRSLKELAVGFLLSESFIDGPNEITDIEIQEDNGEVCVTTSTKRPLRDRLRGKRTITSGCGKGTSFYNSLDSARTLKIQKSVEIDPQVVLKLMREFNEKSLLFRETGGTHGCAVCSKNSIILHEEDIGRHNAMDKVIGRARLEDIELSDKIILATGRVSSELLIKAAKQGIPAVVSRSAPTSLAVELAKETGIVLIGFARGDKLNIYSSFPSTKI